MSAAKKLMTGLLLLSAAGCTAASSRMKYSAPTAPPDAGAAKVIFYRTPAYAGDKLTWEVWDGDQLAGVAENGGYFEYGCAPGRHVFHLMSGSFLGEGRAVDAELAGGKTYYIRAHVGTGLEPSPGRSPDERRKRDDEFGRCGCRELRRDRVTDERLAKDREAARKHAEDLRGPRASQCFRMVPEDGD
jgi:hypothetical protein